MFNSGKTCKSNSNNQRECKVIKYSNGIGSLVKPTGLMEDSPTPTFLGLTAIEWHTFGYGVKERVRFWKRTPLAWDDAK